MSQGHQMMYSDISNLFNDEELARFMAGTHRAIYQLLGAHPSEEWHRGESCVGVRFAVWAPNASSVSVIGDFNEWDGRCSPLIKVQTSDGKQTGVWSTFVPEAHIGQRYQYQLHDYHGHLLPNKADPIAFSAEIAPGRASRICGPLSYQWSNEF